MNTTTSLSKRISQLEEGARPGEQRVLSIAWEDGEPFARLTMQGDICLDVEDIE
jgi:hypothetical protein